ncbi:reverse transcriptase [Senna tora]|uniref:Reverse transcriptase n=1 Tax=Senna tora TaxID=362788 RepID=A0A834XBJ6_9FABA|nr:reverse transcriptase [Senna tora]
MSPSSQTEFKKVYNASPLWKKLQKNVHIVTDNLKWRVGNGESIWLSDKNWVQPDHQIQECQFAKMVWFGSSLMIRTDQINQSSIIDWIDCQLNQAIQQKDDLMESLVKHAIIICWSIYAQRNQVIFQNAKKDPLKAIHRVVQVSQKMSMAVNLHKDFFLLPPGSKWHQQNSSCSWK